jgi:hypothetical protein
MSIMNAKRYGHYDETCKQSKTISDCWCRIFCEVT